MQDAIIAAGKLIRELQHERRYVEGVFHASPKAESSLRLVDDSTLTARGGTLYGFPLRVDPELPEGRVEFRCPAGDLLGAFDVAVPD